MKKYLPYNIGNYPIVNRQVDKEDQGAEVAADMLEMTLAICKSRKRLCLCRKALDGVLLLIGLF